jgi:hypothetical protein
VELLEIMLEWSPCNIWLTETTKDIVILKRIVTSQRYRTHSLPGLSALITRGDLTKDFVPNQYFMPPVFNVEVILEASRI